MTSPQPASPPESPLAIPDFRFFLLARFFANWGTIPMVVILGYQLYETARGPLYGMGIRDAAFLLGLLGLVQFVPLFLLAPVTGWTADRFERRTVVRTANGVDLLISVALAAATWSGTLTLPLLFALAALHGAARGFIGPASSSIVPNIVPPELLPRAIAMSTIAWQGAAISGPAIAGYLYAANTTAPYVMSSVSLAISILALTPIRRVVPPPMAADRHPLRQMLDGLTYVGGHKFLLGAITLDLFAVLLGGATALLPVYAYDILKVGSGGLGAFRAAIAIGSAAVALWFAFRPLKNNVGVKMLAAVAAFGAFTAVFGLSTSMPLSLVALAGIGACDMFSVYVRSSLVQLHTPDAMRGRVSAVSGVAISASNELGEVQSGLFAALLGPVGAVVFGGVAAVAVALGWAYIFPELRRARTFAPPESLLSNADLQERPA
ncbi:MFS transporter [Sphingomonas sp. SUN039]|uniref:MFS transporter n=1 Tax=Sphingomonas sp. SUN039 TaxID=2937787 RepID=UPI0021646C00|nr:MFS transporter [Sphingomonas sp. SUN039]UVO52905.1 MFS transporter [Sphingomonas sp. SUN039]